jgi:hypothetical protein
MRIEQQKPEACEGRSLAYLYVVLLRGRGGGQKTGTVPYTSALMITGSDQGGCTGLIMDTLRFAVKWKARTKLHGHGAGQLSRQLNSGLGTQNKHWGCSESVRSS